jgi:hypothetical protein
MVILDCNRDLPTRTNLLYNVYERELQMNQMKKFMFATTATLSLIAGPVAADIEIPDYSWNCSSKAFYHMEVGLTNNPDGSYVAKASVDPQAIKIDLMTENDKNVREFCNTSREYVVITSSYEGIFGNTRLDDGCSQIVSMSRRNGKLDEIRAVILHGFQNGTLLLHPEDNDVWTFTLSKVWLNTIKGAREMNIYNPNMPVQSKPETDVSFLTGQCVLTFQKDHSNP